MSINNQLDTKICKKCGKEKPLGNFYDGRASCKNCIIESHEEYRKSKPLNKSSKEQNRKQMLKSNYNLSVKEYEKLFFEQGGKCTICGTPQSELKKNLCVDHDHKTGKVRGLLCVLCNQGLGSFKDNQSNIENALYYLILHK